MPGIRKDKKRLVATLTGIELIDTIQNGLLKSAELTGQWEKKLRMIEEGSYRVTDFMEELKVMVNEVIHEVKCARRKAIAVETEEEKVAGKPVKEQIPLVLKCPKCGNGEIIKGRTAWGCSLYKKSCDFLIPMEIQGKKITQKQVESIVLKGKTGVLSGFKDTEGNAFSGTLRLDEFCKIVIDKK